MVSFHHLDAFLSRAEAGLQTPKRRVIFLFGWYLFLLALYPPSVEQFIRLSSQAVEGEVRFEHKKFTYLYEKSRDLTYTDLSDPRSHESKLGFRIGLPLILKALGFGELGRFFPLGLYLFQCLLGVLALWYLFVQFGQRYGEGISAVMMLLVFTPLYVFAQFVCDTIFFDGLGYLLLFICFFERRAVIWCGCAFYAMLCDERALLTLILILLYRFSMTPEEGRGGWRENAGLLLLVCAAYAGFRIGFQVWGGVESASGILLRLAASYFMVNAKESGMLPVLFAFKGYVLMIGASIVGIFRLSGREWVFLGVAIAFMALSYTVIDTVRSLSYLFPMVFFFDRVFLGVTRMDRLRRLAGMALLNVVLPTAIMKTETEVLTYASVFFKGIMVIMKKIGLFLL